MLPVAEGSSSLLQKNERIAWFDYAKGIAIILVVYGHVLHEVFKTGLHPASGFCFWSDSFVYSFPMPLFFFISGVLLSKQVVVKDIRTLLLGKCSVILYPYFIWSIIQGGIELVLSFKTGNPLSLPELTGSLFWQPRAQFWFLHALFCMSVLAILVCRVVKKNTAIWLFAFSTVVYFVGSATLQGFEANFIYFAGGVWLGWERMLRFSQQITMRNTIIVIMLFFTLEVVALAGGFDSYRLVRLSVAASGILFTFVLSIFLCGRKSVSFVRFLGEHSLPVYLMHVLVYKVVFLLLFALHMTNYVLFLGTGVVVGLVVPAYMYSYFVKKDFLYLFNMNKWLRRI